MPKTWREKLDGAKPPHVAVLAKAFAGLPPGAGLFIASPRRLEAYVRAIPPGETRSIAEMRRELAAAEGADATCPTSTGIFLRILAEAALEDMNAGAPADAVAPFWRVVDPDSPLATKLTCGPDFVRRKRREESPAYA